MTSETQPLWKALRAAGQTRPDDVLRRLELRFPPIDVDAIARRLGVWVERVASPGWSGSVNSTDEQATIWLAAEESPVRQRFTLAHELGHLLLHPLGRAYRDISFKGSAHEAEANAFAAGLLMPAWMVRPALEVTGPDPARLAAMFGVSAAAMTIQLEAIGVRAR